jgi:hypothetical protein
VRTAKQFTLFNAAYCITNSPAERTGLYWTGPSPGDPRSAALFYDYFKTAVLLNNNYIIPSGPQYLFGPRLGCAREYGSVMVDQKIVSDHEKCAIFAIAALF